MDHYFRFHRQGLSLSNLLRFRERYVFTRNKRLRLRYSAGAVSVALVALIVGMHSNNSDAVPGIALDEGVVELASADIDAGAEDTVGQAFISDALRARISDTMRSAPSIIKKADKVPYKRVSVGSGQTIAGVLQDAGVSGSDAYYAVKALSKHFDPRKVKSGQKLEVHFKELDDGSRGFDRLSMKVSAVKKIEVQKEGNEEFVAELEEQELERKLYGGYATIQTSLYGSAARADIPSPIIAEMIRIYSWNVDFQRDIRRGDKVKILYEAYENEDGDFAKYGNILFASLDSGGREKPVYRFEMDNGDVDYFEPDGTSVRKTLMKTPVDGARISSNFGMRKHPILGYNKMHKGMDFAAPTGTPIYAAGDGVVEYAGRKGAYGNYMRIRHNSKLKTAYAHMSKFKRGMKQGTKVKQGEVIAYVGSTGRSTGPHLHYEVHLNGTQVDPRSVKLPTGETLLGKQLSRFKTFIRGIDQQYASLTRGLKFAARDEDKSSNNFN